MNKIIGLLVIVALAGGCMQAQFDRETGNMVSVCDVHPLRRHAIGQFKANNTVEMSGFEGDTSHQVKDIASAVLGGFYAGQAQLVTAGNNAEVESLRRQIEDLKKIIADSRTLPIPAPVVTPPVVAPVQTNAPVVGAVMRFEQTGHHSWQFDPNDATEDIILRSVTWGGSGIKLDYDCPQAGMLEGKSMDGGTWTSYAGVQAWVPAANGTFRGGYFDHLITQKGCNDDRDLKNIEDNNYWGAGHSLPSGALVNIMSIDGKHRSNLVAIQ